MIKKTGTDESKTSPKKAVAKKTASKKKVAPKKAVVGKQQAEPVKPAAATPAKPAQAVEQPQAADEKKAPAAKKAPAVKKRATSKPAKKATIGARERYEMIATMAYYRAEARNFAPGNDEQDWFECEQLVDEMLSKNNPK